MILQMAHKIHFLGKEQCAMLSQLRVFDSIRLERKMGQLPTEDYEKVLEALKGMI